MPSYDNYPVEGYVHDEPGGRPRPGRRYRSPAGDRRVLFGMVGLFVAAVLVTLAWAWMERANTLTEWAFGDDRHACGLGGSPESILGSGPLSLDGTFSMAMDVERVLEERPEVRDAAGFALTVDVKDKSGRELLGTDRPTFDTRTVDWSVSELRFEAPTDLGDVERKRDVVICDLLLETVDAPGDLGPNPAVPLP